MFSISKIITAAALTLCVASPVYAQQAQVDQTFTGREFKWDSSGGIVARARALIQDGQIYVCGVYAFQGGPKKARLAQAVMKDGTIRVNGQVIERDLRFFYSVSPRHYASRLDGQTANCRTTGHAGTEADLETFELLFRSGRYRVRG